MTTFGREVSFKNAKFNNDAWFGSASFKAAVDFSSATFEKKADFGKARFQEDANFWRCTFTGCAEFRDTVFLKTASFWPGIFNSTASFSNASFARANFRASEFKGKAAFMWCAFGFADFMHAEFSSGADFFDSRFAGRAYFGVVKFDAGVRLRLSEFGGEARFTFATFNGEVDFSHTVFKDFCSFSGEHGGAGFGKDATADFRHARFEIPGRVSFHGLTLRPHWFVNLDPREFEFVDVKWIGSLSRNLIDQEIGNLRKREELEQKKAADSLTERRKTAEQYHDDFEIERLKKYEVEEARADATKPDLKGPRFYRLLSIACRQLAVNAEENHRYDQGSDLRFWAMEVQRKEGWRSRGRLTIGILHTLYRYLSGYGEEIGRAFLVLLGICLLFAFIYTRVGFVHSPSTIAEATVSTTDEVGQPLKR